MVKTMYAIEFNAKIKDGTIDIPEEYRDQFKTSVRVILMAEESIEKSNYIAQLLKKPIKVVGFEPMAREEIHERS